MNEQAQGKQYYLPQHGIEIVDGDYEEHVDPKMEAENAEFEQFKSEMHDAQFDAKIMVGKKFTDSAGRPIGRQVFECFECGIDDYTFSQLCTRIREDFGTGLYKVQGRDSKGKYKFDKTVGILAPNQTDNKPANDVGGLIDKMSDAMQRQQISTEQMLTKIVGPQTGGDAFDQMTKMMTAMGGMMAAMGLKPNEPVASKTLLEQMTEYKMMMELFGGEGGFGGGGEANLYSLLTATMQSFGGPIAAALAAGQASGEVNAQGLLANPDKPPATFDDGKKTAEQIQQEKDTEALKAQIKLLVANAEGGADAETMAELIVDKTPEENIDSLYDFLSGDDWFEQIVFLVAEAKPHKNWFTIMRDLVIERLTEDDDPPIVPKVPLAQSETVAENDTSGNATTGSDIREKPNGDAPKDS